MMQLLADPSKAANFARIVFDLLVQGQQIQPPSATRISEPHSTG
jgi:type I restriction enzyme R subunit